MNEENKGYSLPVSEYSERKKEGTVNSDRPLQ